jgi:signal transduction histidine kinase
MTSSSKPSAVSATASRHNVFLTARLRLTALYVLLVSLIVSGFSLFLYRSILNNLLLTSDDDFASIQYHQHFIAHTISLIQNTLILSDIIILVVAAVVIYVLAGRTLQPVQRALEAQRLFAAEASHELRTPLAIMRNDIEVLLRNAQPNAVQMRAILDSNVEEIKKMSGIVEDLLILARSENAVQRSLKPVDIGELAKNVTEKMQPLGAKKGVSVSFAGELHAFIKGNSDALERALVNILQNALEHTDKGEVTVAIAKNKSSVQVVIRDTGKGIDDEDLPRVFDRFYKGRFSDENSGSGLGLAIVKEIVEQHKGTILLDSTRNKGTSITLSFHPL